MDSSGLLMKLRAARLALLVTTLAGCPDDPEAIVRVDAPSSWNAGTPGTLTLRVVDGDGELVDVDGTFEVSTDDPDATIDDATVDVVDGQGTLEATFFKVGAKKLVAKFDGLTGTFPIEVAPAEATDLVFIGLPESATAGSTHAAQVVVVDSWKNLVSTSEGDVEVTSTDPAFEPQTVALAQGIAPIEIRLETTGDQIYTATWEGLEGSASVFVESGVASELRMLGLPEEVDAGAVVEVAFEVVDAFGNPAPNASGPLTLASSNAIFDPEDPAIAKGLATVDLAFEKVGTKTVSASFEGLVASAQVVVRAGPVAGIQIDGLPSSITAGYPTSLPRVLLVDAFDNVVFGSAPDGVVTITSSDPLYDGDTETTFDGDFAPFEARFVTPGLRSVTAEYQGFTHTRSITVNPTWVSGLVLEDVPSTVVAGAPVTFGVRVVDGFGYPVVTANGAISVSATSGTFAPVSLTNGEADVTGSFTQVGTKLLTVSYGIHQATRSIAVTHGPQTDLRIVGVPPSLAVGANFTLQLAAVDAFDNVVSSSSAALVLSSTDPLWTGPSVGALSFGVAEFPNVRFLTAGTHTITASDGSFQASRSTNVGSAPVASLVITGLPSQATAGEQLTFVVNAVDAGGNAVPSASGALGLTTIGGAFGPASLASGQATVTGSFTAAGARTVTATFAGVDGSAGIIIAPGDQAELRVLDVPGDLGLGEAFTPTIAAVDDYGNVVTSSASLTISATDPAWTGETSAQLVGGVAILGPMTYGTYGEQQLYVTDGIFEGIASTFVTDDGVTGRDDELAMTEDVQRTVATSLLLANDDPGVGGGPLVIASVASIFEWVDDGEGNLELVPLAGLSDVSLVGGNVVITPDANFSGETAFEYDVTDGLTTRTAIVRVTIAPVPDAPFLAAEDAEGHVDEATPLIIEAALLDLDGSEVLTVEIAGIPADAEPSAGVLDGGVLLLAESELAGLVLVAASEDSFDLDVTAFATESDGSVSTAATTLSVDIAGARSIAGLSEPLELTPGDALGTITFLGTPAVAEGFTAGCLVGRDDIGAGVNCIGNDQPQHGEVAHTVRLTRELWVARTETTQGQWEALAPNPAWHRNGLDTPVEQVNVSDAAWFANRVSEAAGLPPCYFCSDTFPSATCDIDVDVYACIGYRLPTEAEFEWIMRAGEDHAYPGSDVASEVSWFFPNANVPQPVAGLAPNAFGLFDTSGNVVELTTSGYGPYPTSEVTNPLGVLGAPQVVLKGGSYASALNASHQSTARSNAARMLRGVNVGFRLVRSK